MGALDSKRFEKGRNFSNKVWNATRFVLTSLDPQLKYDASSIEARLADQDRWILSRLNAAAAALTESLERFEFSKATNALYAFFWDEFCAWTIELSKPRLAPANDPADRAAAQAVLLHVLDRSLRLLHPFCPFLSEALWAELAKAAPSAAARSLGHASGPSFAETPELLARAPWPAGDAARRDPELEAQFASLFEAVRAVRNIRQKNGIGPKEPLRVSIRTKDDATARRFEAQRHVLERMAQIAPPAIGPAAEKPKPAGTEVLEGAELYVALAGLIDPEKERARLAKEIERTRKAVAQGRGKLANEKFVKNAPPETVDAERARLAEYEAKAASLEAALKELG
ncbi:MAG: class I tRNA ligase family protein [Planctomycetota bacterium]|nr:class I tRNA ligase family protein [Planctomycetota bacterium]